MAGHKTPAVQAPDDDEKDRAAKAEGPAAGDGGYGADSIKVLEGLEAVRKRPAMYIGDVTARGLHHLVFEIVDNSIDEAMAGHCKNIAVRLRADGAVSVEDDGRGIPVGINKEQGVSAVELVFCKLHAGGKFDHNAYKVSGGLHGVGASVVNALSEWLEVEICRDDKIHHMSFRRGDPASSLKELGKSTKRGTKVTFKPDNEIFQTDTAFAYETIAKRLRELAYLLGSRGLSIVVADERTGQAETFQFAEGVKTFVENLNQNKTPIHATVVHLNKEIDRLVIEVALQYNDGYHEDVYCFANNINTHEGGTHLSGFRSALTRTLNAYAKKEGFIKESETPPAGEDFREGLAAVISVLVPDPLFESQTKVKLGNAEVEGAVQTVVNDQLGKFLEEHPGEAKSIVNKALLAMRAREAARKQRDLVRKSAMVGGGLPGKLADCQTRKAEDAEIFLVEGDSAGGSAKQARDRRTQAILPLRGKILNVEKARLDRMLGHEEIRTIITALGTGIGADDFSIEKLRYGKVIIMSVDAEEHVFVRDSRGVRMTKIGAFVDAALAERSTRDAHCERRAGDGLGEVLCFGVGDHQVRFRPIRSVLRHPLTEELFDVRTAYGRSVRVTASHSVFVHEDGAVRLKFGAQLKVGDRIVAPRRMRLPEDAPPRIDLLKALHSDRSAARQLWLRGPAVEAWHRARVTEQYAQRPEFSEARVEIPADVRAEVAVLRRRHGVRNSDLCVAVGIRQSVTFHAWESGAQRPTLSHWKSYLEAIGADVEGTMARVTVGPSRLERTWAEQYAGSARNRVRPLVRMSELTDEDVAWFGGREDFAITPERHAERGLGHFLAVTPELMLLLGFHLAEGSCSERGGIRFSIGRNNERLLPELVAACRAVFGVEPKHYVSASRVAELRVVHRVASLAWERVFGFRGVDSTTKRIPDLVFNVAAPLRAAFLRGYFLGDGTASHGRIAFATSARDVASGLSYLLGACGVVASIQEYEPDRVERSIRGAVCRTTHRHWIVTVGAAEDLAQLRSVWSDHSGSPSVDARLARKRTCANRRFEAIDGDLMALPVTSIAAVAPSNGQVYDFSVEGDENFVAGMGGLCCHNTDADVDGSHIRTLLLTFFYRQMKPLVENGKIYCAAPPLYRVKRGKLEQYVHNEEELLRIKRDLGIRGAELLLVARNERLAGEAMKPLIEDLARLERAGAHLEKRGVSLRELAAHARPVNGAPRVPQYRVTPRGAAREYLADDAALQKFLDAARARKPDLTVSYEGDENADVHVVQLHERADIDAALEAFAKRGLTLDHVIGVKAGTAAANGAAPFKLKLESGEREFASLREVADAIRADGERDLEIQRYKGLGEMNPEQLWESTMDPARRTMYQVRAEDMLKADEIFTVLMGEEVEPRRAFIEKHALEVRNLDI
jgi:DNA gyrase subunit B